jgi:hypothetical protein
VVVGGRSAAVRGIASSRRIIVVAKFANNDIVVVSEE